MIPSNTERELGTLSTKIDYIESEVTEIKADVKAIRTTLDQQSGAKQAAGVIGSIIGGIVGTIITAAVALIVKFF